MVHQGLSHDSGFHHYPATELKPSIRRRSAASANLVLQYTDVDVMKKWILFTSVIPSASVTHLHTAAEQLPGTQRTPQHEDAERAWCGAAVCSHELPGDTLYPIMPHFTQTAGGSRVGLPVQVALRRLCVCVCACALLDTLLSASTGPTWWTPTCPAALQPQLVALALRCLLEEPACSWSVWGDGEVRKPCGCL